MWIHITICNHYALAFAALEVAKVFLTSYRSLNVMKLIVYFILFYNSGTTYKPKAKLMRSNEFKIKRWLLKRYDATTRPVFNDSTTIEVNLAISLYHILDTVSLAWLELWILIPSDVLDRLLYI